MSKQPLKLNLGCGSNKIDGFVNIDTELSCKPDLVHNFVCNRLPYKDNTVDEIICFHTIEHIQKRFHKQVLNEIWRVLKPSGNFVISYPEFIRCVDNWRRNYKGKREFWEATIFGRQLYESDFHVCIMYTPIFVSLLKDCGFSSIEWKEEPQQAHNTVVYALKGERLPGYEDLIRADMSRLKIKRVQNAA